MITSPSPSTAASSSITVSTTVSGTMIHTTRGGVPICSTMAVRLSTSESSAFMSYPMTVWPASRRRSRMLPPILPSPTSPICMVRSLLGRPPFRRTSAGWVTPRRKTAQTQPSGQLGQFPLLHPRVSATFSRSRLGLPPEVQNRCRIGPTAWMRPCAWYCSMPTGSRANPPGKSPLFQGSRS